MPGSKLQEHVRKLGHRNETGHTGFEEEYFGRGIVFAVARLVSVLLLIVASASVG